MQPICKKLIANVNIHVGESQWYRLYRNRHGIGLMWNEVESIHRRILDMVFAVAIDSDVRVNINRWHFRRSGGIRCSNCINQYCLCQNVDISHQLSQFTIFAYLLSVSHLMDKTRICYEPKNVNGNKKRTYNTLVIEIF